MRLYPCPFCKADPMVVSVAGGVMAVCECAAIKAKDRTILRHRWNGLYCADDPATAADCEEEGRCPGATDAEGATSPFSAMSSCRGCTPFCAPTAPGAPARR